MIKHLSYVSTQSYVLHDNDLERLLNESRSRNTKAEITGILIHLDGHFIQFLEGPEENIDKVFRSIQEDNRHHDIKVLSLGESSERCFDDWQMIFKRLKHLKISDIPIEDDFKPCDYFKSLESYTDEEAHAVKLLHSFVLDLS